jgi:lipid II:glycine glycyltransferase (peptidoglycan interpeptide bridge formation enzyme)
VCTPLLQESHISYAERGVNCLFIFQKEQRKVRVKSVTTREWQQFVEGLPYYSFFQLPIWAQVHEKTYPNSEIATKLFTFDDGVQVLVPLVKTRHKFGFESLESLPKGGYGGLLWDKRPTEGQVQQILEHLLNRRVLRLEIYPSPWDYENREFLENSGLERRVTFTHVLELLAGHQWLWENKFDAKSRNSVRRALKNGVTITLANDVAQIRVYYDLYLDSARRWGLSEKELTLFQFFEDLFRIGGDRVKYYLARYGGKYISGGIIFYDSSSCFYWGAAMLKEYGQYCPNHLIVNKAIEDACARGFRIFNFGSSEGLPGVQRFKETFGAEKIDYEYFIYENPRLRLYRRIKVLGRSKVP